MFSTEKRMVAVNKKYYIKPKNLKKFFLVKSRAIMRFSRVLTSLNFPKHYCNKYVIVACYHGSRRSVSSECIKHIKSSSVCTCVRTYARRNMRFNFSKNTGCKNIKLGTIYHHLGMSVI